MRVLIADKFDAKGIQRLSQLGCDVRCDAHLSGDALVSAMQKNNPEVLIVRSTQVTERVLSTGDALSLIIRAGAGINNIDVECASRRGVYVANCPGMNAAAVAELVFGLMISLDRRIAHNVHELREGVWNKQAYSNARGLKGATLGIVGLGKVGQAVGRRAAAFDMRVVYSDAVQHADLEAEYGYEKLALDDLLRQSDFVTLHVPLVDETRRLIDDTKLKLMKPSAHIINTSRGEVIDPHALAMALDSGLIAGAGLDVFDQEPSGGTGEFKDPLARSKDLYGTHHIGAATAQAQSAVAEEVTRIVRVYMETGSVPNCINTSGRSHASHVLIVRHHNRPGILAHILAVVNHAQINVEEMANNVFDRADACCAHIRLDGPLQESDLVAIRTHEMIMSAKLIKLSAQ